MNTVTINYQAFKDSWGTIGSFVKKERVFPRTASAFEQRYGIFPGPDETTRFLAAISSIDGILAKIGHAEQLKQLIAQKPDYLTRPTAPETDLYGKTVWFSNQVANTAGTVVETFEGWGNLSGQAAAGNNKLAQKLTGAITGSSGIAGQISALSKIASALADFTDPEISGYSKAFRAISDTKLLDEANETIGRLEAENSNYASRIAKLKGGEGKLGGLFSGNKNKKEIESLTQKIAANEKELAKKNQLTADLDTPFFITGNKLSVTLEDIKNNLSVVSRNFSEFSNRLTNIIEISSAEQLSDYQWVAKAFDLEAVISAWKQLQASSTNYAVNAFVS